MYWAKKKGIAGLDLHSADARCIFQPPASVEVVGSSALRTGTAPFVNVDIAVGMPSELFNSRDLLNHGYFDKRKLFLSGLHQAISAASGLETRAGVTLGLLKADVRKPVLVLQHVPDRRRLHARRDRGVVLAAAREHVLQAGLHVAA